MIRRVRCVVDVRNVSLLNPAGCVGLVLFQEVTNDRQEYCRCGKPLLTVEEQLLAARIHDDERSQEILLVRNVLIWVTIREIQKIIPEDFDAGIVPTVASLPVGDLYRRA